MFAWNMNGGKQTVIHMDTMEIQIVHSPWAGAFPLDPECDHRSEINSNQSYYYFVILLLSIKIIHLCIKSVILHNLNQFTYPYLLRLFLFSRVDTFFPLYLFFSELYLWLDIKILELIC